MKNISVVGFYKTKNQINRALQELKNLGIHKSDIKVMYPNYPHKKLTQKELHQVKVRSVTGTIIGLSIFGFISLIISFRLLPADLLPFENNDLDAFFAINGILTGILTGAFIGALIGALSGLSLSKKAYSSAQKDVSSGDIILSVHLEEKEKEKELKIKELLKKTGAGDINSKENSEDWETKILPLT